MRSRATIRVAIALLASTHSPELLVFRDSRLEAPDIPARYYHVCVLSLPAGRREW